MYQYRKRYTPEQKKYLKSILHTLSTEELQVVQDNWWEIWGRSEQTLYLDYPNYDWWLYIAGRGTGKTIAGVGWCIKEMMDSKVPLLIAVVCPTDGDIVGTIITGDSGFLRRSPKYFYPIWNKTRNWLDFPNGHQIRCFSAESPERLRGPNFSRAWIEELCAFPGFESGNVQALQQIEAATRIGEIKIAVTTTPQNSPWLRNKLKDAKDPKNRIIVSRGTTFDNRENLGEGYFRNIGKIDSPWKRQEYLGELINLEGVQPILIEDFKIWGLKKPLPTFEMVIPSFDTAYTKNERNDPTGMACLGIFWDIIANDWSGMILDTWLRWLTYPELVSICKSIWHSEYGYNALGYGKEPDYLLVENRSSGQALLPDLANAGIEVAASQPTKDKGERLSDIAPLVKEGRIWVVGEDANGVEMAFWVKDLINRICNYPAVEYDDDIDAFSQVVKHLKTSQWIEISGRLRKRPIKNRVVEKKPFINPYAQ